VKIKRLLPVGFLAVSVFTAGITFGFLFFRSPDDLTQRVDQTVLGETVPDAGVGNQKTLSPISLPTRTPTVAPPVSGPSPTPREYSVSFTNEASEVTLPNPATFTWTVNGPPKTISTTTVYYGTDSSPGPLSKTVVPADVRYSGMLKDFMEGTYAIPLVFVGNANFSSSGTYYYRAYAVIDGKNYWSDERTLTVRPEPKNEIRVIDRPSSLFTGDTTSFTWEITGPAGTTPFTAIVGGKESKTEGIGEDIGLQQTPYAVLVNDFTQGNFSVPLRYIGNFKVTEPGTFYFRALAFINGKNIWSNEYSFTVQ